MPPVLPCATPWYSEVEAVGIEADFSPKQCLQRARWFQQDETGSCRQSAIFVLVLSEAVLVLEKVVQSAWFCFSEQRVRARAPHLRPSGFGGQAVLRTEHEHDSCHLQRSRTRPVGTTPPGEGAQGS